MKILLALLLSFALFPKGTPLPVTYRVFLSGLPEETALALQVGEPVTEAGGKGDGGKVFSLAISPHRVDVYLPEKGEMGVAETPLLDVILTVKAQGREKDGTVLIGTFPLKIGAKIPLHLPHFAGEGVILEVSCD